MTVITVPSDGNCLLHSIALAFLDPTSHKEEFERRFQKLFGSGYDDECNVLYQQFSVNAIDANLYKHITTSNKWENLIDNFRVKLVTFMELHSSQLHLNPANPSGYIPNNGNFYNSESFAEYLSVIEKQREWLGSLEIYATSLLLECCIIVCQQRKNVAIFNEQSKPLLELEYDESKKHYNFILKCSPIPRQKRKSPMTELEFFETTSYSNSVGHSFKRFKSDQSVLTYDASGVKRALHGTVYQLELLMLFLLRIKNLSEVFFLATEMDFAEKFDDVVVKYKTQDSEIYKWRFLQAKHKQDTEKHKITIKELMSYKDDDFSLQKYFVSFYKIKCNKYFRGSELEDFCILTNTTLDLEIDEKDSRNLRELKEKWKCLLTEFTDLHDDQILFIGDKEIQVRFKQDRISLENLSNVIKVSLKQAITNINKKASEIRDLLSNSTLVPDKIKEQIKSSNKDDLSDTVLSKILLIDEKLQKFNKKTLKDKYFGLADDILEINPSSQLRENKEKLKVQKTVRQKEKDEFLEQLKKHLNIFLQKMTNIEDWLESSSTDDSTVKLQDLKRALENFDTYFYEFVSKFRFVVNYPNVDDLNLQISLEIGADENLLTPDLFTHSFEKVILDWLKQKNGVFLSFQECSNIFYDIQEQIQTLKVAGLSKAYPEKLSSYKTYFKETLPCVSSFLKDENISILHLTSVETQLTSIKLLETLKELRNYSELSWLKGEDSFIFIQLDLLVLQEIQKIAINSFSSKLKSQNLFIIECNSNFVSEKECTRLVFKLQGEIRKDTRKKLICIGKQDDHFIKKFRNITPDEYEDRTVFNDLDQNSQENILSQKILFQGKDVELGQVIDNTLAPHLIDESLLIKLIKNDSVVVIGDKLKTHFNYNPHYYITRKLQHQKLNKSIFNTDLHFFVSNISEEQLMKLRVKRENLCNLENFSDTKSVIFTESSDTATNECYFNELYNKLNLKSFHWIIFRKGILLWRSSKGDVENILEHVDQESNNIISEDDVFVEDDYCRFFNITQNSIILADNPGMGKSTLQTSVALKIKETHPHWFVYVINLNDYSSLSHPHSLRNVTFDDDDLEAGVDYCSSIVLPATPCVENNFIKQLFKTSLLAKDFQSHLNIVLLFDGFDEISPTYKNQTIKLLKALQKTNIKQFWISTRLHVKYFLEKELNCSALLLNHFTNWDKILFLNKFLKWHLKYKETNLENALNNLAAIQTFNSEITYNNDSLNVFIQDILKLLETTRCHCSIEYKNYLIDNLDPSEYSWILLLKWQKIAITRRKGDITSNPLHLKMLADVTFRRIENINENLNILILYETFINGTFDIFFNDKKTMGEVLSSKMMEISSSMNYKKIHQELAQNFFIAHKNIKLEFSYLQNEINNFIQYNYEPNESKITVEQVLVRIGLVLFNSGIELTFIHATFAEYFLFEWLLNNLQEEQVQEVLVKTILIDDDYSLTCEFFEIYLSKKTEINNCNFTEKIVSTLAQHNAETYSNNSIFHLAIMRDHPNILKFVLDRFKNYDIKHLKKVLIATNRRRQTVLEVANIYKNVTCFQILLYLYNMCCKESLDLILISTVQNSFIKLENNERENDFIIFRNIISFAKQELNLEHFQRLLLTPVKTVYSAHNRVGTCNILHLLVYLRQKSNLEFLLNEIKDYPSLSRRLLLNKEFGNSEMTPFYFALLKNYFDIVNVFVAFLQKRPILLSSVLLESDNKGNILHPKILENTITVEYFIKVLGECLNPSELAKVLNITLLHCNNQKETLSLVIFTQKIDKEVLKLLLNKINLKIVCEDMLLVSMYSKNMPIAAKCQFLEWFAVCLKETEHNYNTSILETVKNMLEKIPLVAEKSINLAEKIKSSSSDLLNNIFSTDELCQKLLTDKELLLAVKINGYISITEFLLQNSEAKIQRALLHYLSDKPYILRAIVSDTDVAGTILHKLTIKNKIEPIKLLFNYLNKSPNITQELILKVNQNGEMAAHLSVRNKNLEILKIILNQTIGEETLNDLIFATNQENQNILEIAIAQMDTNIVELILVHLSQFRTDDIINLILGTYKHTANIISYSFTVSSPDICVILLEYIKERFETCVLKNIFLDSNYLPTISIDSHGNLLFSAARQPKYLVMDILWKYAKIIFHDHNELRLFFASTNPQKNNFLHVACGMGNHKNIQYFLEQLTEFLDVDVVNSLLLAREDLSEMTPVHSAVFYKQYELLKVVLSFCERNLIDLYPNLVRKLLLAEEVSGCTPLLFAVKNNSSECFYMLLDTVKSLESKQAGILKELLLKRNIDGNTILHGIILNGQAEKWNGFIETLEIQPNILDELAVITDNNGETILHLNVFDDEDLENIKLIVLHLKNETITELIIKENNLGLSPLHTAFWRCNSDDVLTDSYVQFLVDEINRLNLPDQTFTKLQKVSTVAEEFENAIKHEDEAEIKRILSSCSNCLKELFLMPTTNNSSCLRIACETNNIDMVRRFLEILKHDPNLLKNVLLRCEIEFLAYFCDFELFCLVLEYAKSINDDKFYHNFLLESNLIIVLKIGKGNKKTSKLLKEEINKIANTLLNNDKKIQLRKLGFSYLKNLKNYIESNEYNGPSQEEFVNIIENEFLRRKNVV